MRICLYIILLFALSSCTRVDDKTEKNDTEHITHIETGNTKPSELLNFACSLEGTPYMYGSTDPKQGLDCSGFITCVFKHFNIIVPRMSVDFTPVDHPVALTHAQPGDLILFTGADSTIKVVGHMGIITANSGKGLTFIHSESGKNIGVIETPFDDYYKARYIKTIRIFPDPGLQALSYATIKN
ncbi:MAG: NlpC/P60 family protein [Bacteroidota bacterium]